MTERPRFADLPVRPGAPRGSTWGLWGDDDEIGTLNLIGPEQVRAAAALVRRGAVFSLNWDLTQPAPPFFGRATLRHTILAKYEGVAVDDFVDGFWPQASSQWDGLRHFADAEHGFYNGASLEEVTAAGAGAARHGALGEAGHRCARRPARRGSRSRAGRGRLTPSTSTRSGRRCLPAPPPSRTWRSGPATSW